MSLPVDSIHFLQPSTFPQGFFDGIPKDCLNRFANIQAVRKHAANTEAIKAFYDAMQGDEAAKRAIYVAARDI